MTAGPVLRVATLGKSFGGIAAVDGVGFEVEAGEIFALLGPSGCGKTTLLRLIAGLEVPDSGTIAIDGEDMTGVPAWRRPVNTVFQSYALFPHMTVAQNIAFGLRQDGLARAEIGRRVDEMVALVQLGGLERRRPDQLSGGQRQRVALARSLAKRPKLLLLDEPLAALDRKLREQTRGELVRIQAHTGTAFILVTHDQEEALALARRVAVMRAGRIEQLGPPRAVYDRPASRYVADFIGRVNLLEGTLVDAGAPAAVRCGALDIVLRARDGGGAAAGAAVWLAVRPEHVALDPHGAGENRMSGTVVASSFLGESVLVDVAVGGGATIRALVPARHAVPAPGGAVALGFAAAAVSVLTR
ncbi:MAG: ABC transporter ATP-binding protein [Alphaproteobacteria bacterium]|nr:ABC transporter ATP-binding protein [Alphaproteobacteria bacterium]